MSRLPACLRLTTLLSCLLICLLVSTSFANAAEDSAHNQPPKGFEALFNGKTLDGWIGMNFHQVKGEKGRSPVSVQLMSPKDRKELLKKNWADVLEHWSVDQGELVNDGHGVYLTTAKDYGDFELLLDYKTVAKADSGIYLRGVPQVQIWDTTKEGGKWDRKANLGSGGLYNNTKAGKYPMVHADKPFGEWNHFRIIMIGENVTVYFNGKLVVDDVPMENYYDRERSIFPTGPIQLQTHGGEIRFRNVFLREIPRTPPEAGILAKGKPVGDGWTAVLEEGTGDEGHAEDEYWKVVDGVLTGKSTGGKQHHYAYTAEEYGDFELHAQVKMTGKNANSGLHFRVDPQTASFGKIAGYEIDLGPGQWGSLQHVGGDGNITKCPQSLADKVIKQNDWNHFYIVAKGDYIQTWINGVKVIDVENPRGPKKGYLAIQLCAGDRETNIELKDVYIRPAEADKRISSSEQDEAGFTPVFNGKNLEGWKGAIDKHIVKNGILSSPPGKGGNLYTIKQYGDFIYRFEFRLRAGGNNGVGIRCDDGKNAAYYGMEIQILDNTAKRYENLHEYQYHGSIYGVAAAKRGYQNAVGEWNQEEIYCKGNRIRVTLNGKVIVDADIKEVSTPATIDGKDHPGLFNKQGSIGFMGHGHAIDFRNMRVKELK